MSKGKIILFLFVFLCSANIFGIVNAAPSDNVGFASANIRYSKDPFMEGDKIKIYTLVINPDSREFSGTVIFFDNTVLLGTKNFIVPANGVKDIYIDWTTTAGDHTIFGKIENAKFLISKGNYEYVYLTGNETEESNRTVQKTIIQNTGSSTNSTATDSGIGSIQNIKNIIAEKTPDFIAKPITNTANAIDGFRESIAIASDKKKVETKTEIDNLDIINTTPDIKDLNNLKNSTNTKSTINSSDNVNTKSRVFKPLKYLELFFLTLSSAIFNNKLIFYGLLAVLLFLLIRFTWRRVF